jgi:hypothetical protein
LNSTWYRTDVTLTPCGGSLHKSVGKTRSNLLTKNTCVASHSSVALLFYNAHYWTTSAIARNMYFAPCQKLFFLLWFLSLSLCCHGDWVLILLSLLSGYCSLPVSLSLDMAPTNKKRALSVPSHSDSTKRAAVARAPKRPASKSPTKKPAAKKLSSLGFSSTKRQLYQPGTKILLTNGIYDDEVPEKVKGHLFLYEIVEWSVGRTK